VDVNVGLSGATHLGKTSLSALNIAMRMDHDTMTATPPQVALSIVAPCYNEAHVLPELHRRLTEVCQQAKLQSYEIVLINDGSVDSTWRVMQEIQRTDENVVAINLSRNFGHQLALTAGLKLCCGQRILIIDADLQDPPELLPAMMARMDEGIDVVYGQRRSREGETMFKRRTALVFYRLLGRLAEIDIPVDTGDFRLMSRRALDALNAMPENHRFVRGMVSWIGLRQEAFPYERAARFAGQTKYPLMKMIRFALDAITGFSIKPLRLASYLGLFSALICAALGMYVLASWLRGSATPGWTSLALIMLFMGSCQLIVTGILGEYLGRLFLESKGRPLFIVQDILRAAPRGSARAERP
jgi:dolichol-phosphate mannosyltransferase